MKSGLYRHRSGSERLWFTPQDVEILMEAELHRAGLYPTREKPLVDLERFVARHLGVALDQHANLEPEVLGLTPARVPDPYEPRPLGRTRRQRR